MKYLLILLLVMVVIWAVKRGRRPQSPTAAKPQETAPAEMITCAHCGIHLPQEEAVSGQKGLYCSTEHRTAAQDRNPV
ncbi:PP0621 family protein [Limnohabitans sp. DCL3]|uniref:PP0621 family protein n=1 Tax=Limnohabitans sp. DCL3 TaxID=3374103 RepID=UPI003A84E28A